MLRVAMLSKWHVHAQGYARDFLKTGKAEITAVWDEKPERGSEWAESLGCDFEADLDKLLARDDVDAVMVCTSTDLHHDVIKKAAEADADFAKAIDGKNLRESLSLLKDFPNAFDAFMSEGAYVGGKIPI